LDEIEIQQLETWAKMLEGRDISTRDDVERHVIDGLRRFAEKAGEVAGCGAQVKTRAKFWEEQEEWASSTTTAEAQPVVAEVCRALFLASDEIREEIRRCADRGQSPAVHRGGHAQNGLVATLAEILRSSAVPSGSGAPSATPPTPAPPSTPHAPQGTSTDGTQGSSHATSETSGGSSDIRPSDQTPCEAAAWGLRRGAAERAFLVEALARHGGVKLCPHCRGGCTIVVPGPLGDPPDVDICDLCQGEGVVKL
jgi:hypothetical protein